MTRPLWYAAIAVLLLLFALLLWLIRPVAIPFLLALILAYFLNPAVDGVQRRCRCSRTNAVGLVFAAFVLLGAVLLSFLVPAIKQELFRIQEALPGYAEGLYRLMPRSVLENLGIGREEDIQTLFDRLMKGARSLSFDVLKQVAVFFSRAFASTLSFLLAILGYLILPVYLFYLLRDFGGIKTRLMDLVPASRREEVLAAGREVDEVLGAFLRGQLTVCLILAVLYSLGLVLIGIDLALVIGIVSGVAFIIPYVGTVFGIVAGGTMAVIQFHDLLHPLLVLLWFGLVQALEGTVITPRIVGDRVGLHPLATILAVLAGGELFGFLGLLLAVPVAAAGKVMFRHLWHHLRQPRLARAGGSPGE